MKTKFQNFLQNQELKDFQTEKRYVNRSGCVIKNNGQTDHLKTNIESAISKICSDHIKLTKESLKLITIEMNEIDGMSWLSQKLFEINHTIYDTFHFYNLDNSAKDINRLPSIAHMIGKNKFLRIAVKNKIAVGFFSLFPLSNWILFIVASILTLCIQLGTYMLRTKTDKLLENLTPSPFGISFILVFITIIVFLIIIKIITERSIFQTESKTIKELMANLNEIEKGIQNNNKDGETEFKKMDNLYNEFINDIVSEFIWLEYPRFLIIDNYGRLDFTTKNVMQIYLQKHINNEINYQGKEIWILTEPLQSNNKLSTDLLLKNSMSSEKIMSQLRIIPFSLKEKKSLIEFVGGDTDWIKFTHAQYICNGQGKSKNWILKNLENLKKLRVEKTYHNLDFLYLLSLTTYPNQYFISKNNFRISFSKKNDLLQSKILGIFLPGVKLDPIELSNIFKDIVKDFSDVIAIQKEKDNIIKIYPLNDVSLTMLQNERILDLPNHKLGHLFWSLYWGTNLNNHPYEVFWVEKLSNHLIKSDYKLIPVEDYNEYISRLLKCCFYCIEGSVRTGYMNTVFEVLDIAKDLILSLSDVDCVEEKKKLLLLSWKTYSITKDDRIINIFVDLSIDHKVEQKQLDELFELYLELIPIPILGGSNNIHNLSNWLISSQEGNSLVYYIKSLSIWTSLSIFPMIHDLDMLLIAYAAKKAYVEIDVLFDSILFESEGKNDSNTVIDLISISFLIWSYALKFQTETKHFKNNELNDYYNDFSQLLIHSSLTIEYLEEKSIVTKQGDFLTKNYFIKAIVGEICLTMLSALTISYNQINESPYTIIFEDKDNKLLNRTKEVYAFINNLLRLNLPELVEFDFLISASIKNKLEDTFNFYGLIWHKLNLQEFHSNLVIKRIQFNVLISNNRSIESIDPNILCSINEVLCYKNQIGVLANVVISKYLEKITELSSYYFTSAGSLLIDGEFGGKIIKDFSALVMVYFNRLNVDLSKFAERIIDSKDIIQNSFLFDVLSKIPEKKLFNIILKLSNSSSLIENSTTLKTYKDSIYNYPKHIKSDPIRRKTNALFDFIELTDNINKTINVEYDTILDKWLDKKDLYFYAAILENLISRGISNERIKREALQVLNNPTDSSYNAYLHLAVTYAERFLYNNDTTTIDEERIVVGYLKNNFFKFESIEKASLNAKIFKILNYFYFPDYTNKLNLWLEKVVEIDHKQLIPGLLRAGHFFILFKKYADNMLYFGLEIDTDSNTYRESIYIEEGRKNKEIDDWLLINKRIPEPIFQNKVSSEFLIIGSHLFSFSVLSNPKYDSLRNDFNSISKASLPRLVDKILLLAKIPDFYKGILEDFYSRLENYKILVSEQSTSPKV